MKVFKAKRKYKTPYAEIEIFSIDDIVRCSYDDHGDDLTDPFGGAGGNSVNDGGVEF